MFQSSGSYNSSEIWFCVKERLLLFFFFFLIDFSGEAAKFSLTSSYPHIK